MKNTIRNYSSWLLSLLVLVLVGFTGCEKDSDMDLSLAVNSNNIVIKSTGGNTHIMVYSTGVWDAILSEKVTWASISKLEEKGNNSVLFSCSRNYGAARNVTLSLTKNGETQEVNIVQEGITPVLTFPTAKFTIPRTALPTFVPLNTNLTHNLSEIVIDVIYDDEISEKWVSEAVVTATGLEFKALENNLGEDRSARVILEFVDGFGKKYATFVDIAQNLDAATISFNRAQTDLPRIGSEVLVTIDGNMTLSLGRMKQEIIYNTDAKDWIGDLIFDNNILKFEVDDNKSDADRSATIKLTLEAYGTNYVVEHLVRQSASSFQIYTFDQLRALISGSAGDLVIVDGIAALKGVVISDNGSMNMETNLNTSHNKMDYTLNDKTAYIQSADGKYGVRLRFDNVAGNTLKRYDNIIIALNGSKLVKESNPERYTLELNSTSIIEVEAGSVSDIATKEKYIDELTDADVYTFATLKDSEVAVPYGIFMNANTGYSLQVPVSNPTGIANGGYFDTYPVGLRDTKGGSLYMLTNGKVPWLKAVLPKGTGKVNGIIVHTQLAKYGAGKGDIGKYSIRPVTRGDIDLPGTSIAHTLVEWNWLKDGHNVAAIGTVNKDGAGNILPVVGTGKMYNTANHTTHKLGTHFINFPNADAKGAVNSALGYEMKWWNTTTNEGEAFVFNFSTTGVSGSNLSINFTQGAGAGSAATIHNPALWQVEYSTDGTNYTVLPNSTYAVRPQGWWNGALPFVPLGCTDHSFKLPNSLFGQANVYVRLKAKSNACATTTGAENGSITASTAASYVRVGIVSFKYN